MDLLRRGSREAYWRSLRADLVAKRNRMRAILERAGIRPIVPQGGYFMLADFSTFVDGTGGSGGDGADVTNHNDANKGNGSFAAQYKQEIQMEPNLPGKPNTNDFKLARWLSRSKKLQGIPGSAFYSVNNKPLAESLIRFCFIKQTSTLDRFENLIGALTSSRANVDSSAGRGEGGSGERRSKEKAGKGDGEGAGGGGGAGSGGVGGPKARL